MISYSVSLVSPEFHNLYASGGIPLVSAALPEAIFLMAADISFGESGIF